MGTVIALASAGIAIATYLLVTSHRAEHLAREEASAMARLIAHSMATDPLAGRRGEAATALLRTRARELIATGRLLSVTVVGTDLEPLAQETVPGLEEEEALRSLGREPFELVASRWMRRVEPADGTVYVLMPLIDSRDSYRGVLAIGVPIEMLSLGDEGAAIFASSALALSVLLGLIAAFVLTGQVARPIGRLARVAERLETGRFDTSTVTPLIGRRDEIGRLARVMLRLVRALDHLGQEMDAAAERRRHEQRQDRDRGSS